MNNSKIESLTKSEIKMLYERLNAPYITYGGEINNPNAFNAEPATIRFSDNGTMFQGQIYISVTTGKLYCGNFVSIDRNGIFRLARNLENIDQSVRIYNYGTLGCTEVYNNYIDLKSNTPVNIAVGTLVTIGTSLFSIINQLLKAKNFLATNRQLAITYDENTYWYPVYYPNSNGVAGLFGWIKNISKKVFKFVKKTANFIVGNPVCQNIINGGIEVVKNNLLRAQSNTVNLLNTSSNCYVTEKLIDGIPMYSNDEDPYEPMKNNSVSVPMGVITKSDDEGVEIDLNQIPYVEPKQLNGGCPPNFVGDIASHKIQRV